MINRVLIRIKVVQMLFCYFLNQHDFILPQAPESASRDKQFAYSQYLDLLLMVLRLSGYKISSSNISFSNKFLTENRLGKALKSDSAVKEAVFRRFQSAPHFDAALEAIYSEILKSGAYRSYTHRKERSINDDVELWSVIINAIFTKSPELLAAARKEENFTVTGYESALKMLDETLRSCGDTRKLFIDSKRALQSSLDKAYELYNRLLSLPVALTILQDRRLDSAKNKYLATTEDLNPNLKFIDNKLVAILANDEQLADFCKDKHISWNDDPDFLMSMLDRIVKSPIYEDYMDSDDNSLEADCELWRQLFKQVILPSDELAELLESKSIYWNDDLEIIGTFVIKTLKIASRNNGESSFILPQFKDTEDAEFGEELFVDTIEKFETYRSYIDRFINSSQWDPERLAFMDVIIMSTAISELLNYPAIPIPVTLNEYIEIANSYSTPRSGQFINGILYSVINCLREEGKLLKS